MTDMEKYGVEEVEDSTKLAAERGHTCPQCKMKLRPIEVTGILICPACGTGPFEQTNAPTKPR